MLYQPVDKVELSRAGELLLAFTSLASLNLEV